MIKMANEIHGILFGNVESVSGARYQPEAVEEESFLQDVVSPIYEVMRKVITSISTFYTVPILVFRVIENIVIKW